MKKRHKQADDSKVSYGKYLLSVGQCPECQEKKNRRRQSRKVIFDCKCKKMYFPQALCANPTSSQWPTANTASLATNRQSRCFGSTSAEVKFEFFWKNSVYFISRRIQIGRIQEEMAEVNRRSCALCMVLEKEGHAKTVEKILLFILSFYFVK